MPRGARQSDDLNGRVWGALRRTLGDPGDPLGWSIPLYRAWGIGVRIHLVFVVLIVARLVAAGMEGGVGWGPALLSMAGLFLLVLLHEYGHCLACRGVGGTADTILMWPLGGLAYCSPPHHWRANLLTTLGGPMVNVILLPILGLTLLMVSGWAAVWFNPFDPHLAWASLRSADGTRPWWLAALWWGHYMNLVLLGFNMLLPMYPMDAGRILQEILWRRLGYREATRIAATVGLGVAIILFVAAMVGGESTLMAIALFGGVTCWVEKRRLADGTFDATPGGWSGASWGDDDDSENRTDPRSRREDDQERLDAILAKIAARGMGSLTWRERRWLRRATERRRGG